MRIVRTRISKNFVIFMFYTINLTFQNTFQIVRKPILRFFRYKNVYETNGLYEALRSYKFFSNFHFTEHILCRPELQKIIPNFSGNITSYLLFFVLKLAIENQKNYSLFKHHFTNSTSTIV